MSTKVRSLVTGAGGFIGRHLVSFLRAQGHWVRGVDLKHPEFCGSDANEYELLDLRRSEDCLRATAEIDEMYALAADVGGTGCGTPDHAQIFHNNRLINLHCIEAARKNRVTRYLYASSTCVYPELCENITNNVPLDEEDAYQGTPQDAYGWANLITERLCIHYRQAYGLETRILRLPDVFGPLGPWFGGRESAPAELCRKIAAAHLEGLNVIEISGDGTPTVSLCYIDDCVTGMYKVMRSDCFEPLNLSQDRMVSINKLADMIAKIAGVRVNKKHVPVSQGVRGRHSDNTRLKAVLRWAPETSLEEGLRHTYLWVEKQVRELALEYSFGIATFPLRSNREF
ncbi:MAG: NAD-dependent epimerase/dehydratase family protein [Acidobacteriia bacterium]|nr:NAD-dependent epimerase/dehydratase family protein [Terriglobia bacterium]